MTKIRVGVLFGGRSAEHDVSLQSALNVINALDKKKYEITLIGIDRRGQWYIQEPLSTLPNQQQAQLTVTTHLNDWVTIVPGQRHTLLTGLMTKEQVTALDIIFPVVHGPYAEDGTIQGLMRLANVPFVGSDVLSSAICMDKDIAKRLARDAGIPISRFVTIYRRDLPTLKVDAIIKEVGLPCFVKPANMGSSIGISKVTKKGDLQAAIDLAMNFDLKVIVEEAISGREIECAVLGNDDPIASLPGEIISHAEFYTYEAKYLDPAGADVVPTANLPAATVKQVQALAIKVFQLFDCDGMARIDFFLKKDGTILLNEINTIPGFTHISQYPKMWEASGIEYSDLLDRLIQLGLEKFDHRQTVKLEMD
ncbi:MAG: D-alanine--D-alanine ligase [Gammaproteobacteria bacterium]|nr:D-alanine--D-alanine ligase [Gammaproteobacteria bacterium]